MMKAIFNFCQIVSLSCYRYCPLGINTGKTYLSFEKHFDCMMKGFRKINENVTWLGLKGVHIFSVQCNVALK